MGILKLVEWKDNTRDTIVYRINLAKDFITKGSKLTVRESQAAVFCDKGRMADVFLPGMYTLDTNNIPILTKLMSWKYGFESPFKSDIYFVNTKQFTNQKWGTINPIIIRDKDYGVVRIRAFGTYSFKVEDPYVFLQELSGTNSSFKTDDITDWLRSLVVTRITDVIGESKIPILDMAGNQVELGQYVAQALTESFKGIGLVISGFNFENFSLPEAIEKALDEAASLGIMGKNINIYTQKAAADAMVEAAKNPGGAGSMMGAGIGMGLGMNMGKAMGEFGQNAMNPSATIKCPGCRSEIPASSKFCPECGKKIITKCPKCGQEFEPGTKFCPECGEKL